MPDDDDQPQDITGSGGLTIAWGTVLPYGDGGPGE